MVRNLGIMVRGDYSGLGNQTRRMVELIRPERVVYIDSTPFSKNQEQHPEWYDSFSGFKIKGFPSDKDCQKFLSGLTHFICCENPMNVNFYKIARSMGVKTFCVVNYEFLDTLNRPDMAEPDYFIMPSHWKIKEMQEKYAPDRVIYLPPPLDLNEFKETREENLNRGEWPIKFLHTVGTLAAHDRNGTLDLLKALKFTKSNFSLTIRSQHPLPAEYISNDPRVSYIVGSSPDVAEIYRGFDVFVLPRRYGGLCLPLQEAMASGLATILTWVSPFTEFPEAKCGYGVKAKIKGEFMARVPIDIYEVDPKDLAGAIDNAVKMGGQLKIAKINAVDLAHNEFSPASLGRKYEELWSI